MRLVVGLGNPGRRYRKTPHNAGFLVCDRLAERNHIDDEVQKFEGRFRRGRIAGEDVGILKPETYMNRSGRSVAEALRYLPAEVGDLILVFDDLDIPFGRLRLRKSGGAGGHKGISSVIEHVGTRDFPRLRVGIGRPPGQMDAKGFVLSKLRRGHRKDFQDAVDLAAEAVEVMISQGMDAAMNRYNVQPADGGK